MHEYIDIEKTIGNELIDLYQDPHFKKLFFIQRDFVIPKYIFKNQIIHIGLNPSYLKKDEGKEVKSNYYQVDLKNPYSYFKKFIKLSDQVGVNWSHIDLLTIRETQQDEIKKLFNIEEGRTFIKRNLELIKILLELAEPKCIVVSNTISRSLLGKGIKSNSEISLGYQFDFDSDLGTDRISNSNSLLKNTPTFFTSMLTGQRALDIGSFERLCWHVKKVISINN